MNLINKPRGSGKTTQLIYTSATVGYPIVCHNCVMVDLIKKMANELNCDIPEPITVADMRNGFKTLGTRKYDNVLVDEIMINDLLAKALNEYLHTNVVACTCAL